MNNDHDNYRHFFLSQRHLSLNLNFLIYFIQKIVKLIRFEAQTILITNSKLAMGLYLAK